MAYQKKLITKTNAVAIALSLALTACSSGGGGGNNNTPENITGTVSAPVGGLAFKQPSFLERLYAGIVGESAQAALNGIVAVGEGVTVQLLEVDAAGTVISNPVLAEATTEAGGTFTITPPDGFTPGPQYIIRALGATETIDARVSDTSVDVDPVTDAASDLITAVADDLTTISTDELEEIVNQVEELTDSIDETGLTSVDDFTTALQTEVTSSEEANNVINSTVSTGVICGTVTNSAGAPLGNIRIVARDFGNWVTRAKTRTAADGGYCLNVPKAGDTNPDGGTFNGQYILGALNSLGATADPLRSATEWWSATGDAYNQFDAEMISVPDTTTVTRDFQLADGARLSGSVFATGTSTAVEGAKVIVREYDAFTPVATARVKADGSWRVNVIAGEYFVEVRNQTLLAYASEVYDGNTGSSNRGDASRVSLNTGDDQTIDFELDAGYLLSGTVNDGAAVTGIRVMVNISSGGAAARLRTNKLGNYRVWLAPDTYDVTSYGQSTTAVDMTASDQVVNFTATNVNTVSGMFADSLGNPVSQVKVSIYGAASSNLELTSSDGSITLYTTDTGAHTLRVLVDSGQSYATTWYNNQVEAALANTITVSAGANDLATLTGNATYELPAAGVLRGTVVDASGNGVANARVSVRSTGGANVFITTRTRGDGSYVLSLPAGNYANIRMVDAAVSCTFAGAGVDIATGSLTTVDYDPNVATNNGCTVTY